MKKILFFSASVLIALLAAALIAGALWLVRPESHRAGLEKAIGDFFKAEARIGRIGWIWAQGSPGIQLHELSLRASGSQADGPDAFSSEKIRLVLDVPELLRKEFKVRSIQLDNPRLDLTRTDRGIEAAGMPLPSGIAIGGEHTDFTWSVQQIMVRSGFLGYEDKIGLKPRVFRLNSIDFKSRPLRPGSPLSFEGNAGFLTPMPNTTFSGTFEPAADGRSWNAALTRLRLGLEKIPVRALEQAFPEFEPLGLRGQFVGALTGSVSRILYDGEKIKELVGDLKFEGVKLFIRAFKSPIQEFNASLHFDSDTVVISSLDGRIAGGEYFGRAEIRNLNKPDPDADFEFRAQNISLIQLFPKPSDGRPQLTGRASFDIAGRVQGRNNQEWLSSLQAQGTASIADGVLVNTNVLRLIFDKLAVSLPGAQEAFARTMPPDLNQRLSVPDTVLAPAQIPFLIGNGGVVYPNFRIAGDGFEIAGQGQQGFGGDIEFRAMIVLDPQISSYIIYCCPDVAAIADAYGRLAMPVRLTGTIRNVRIVPDTNFIIQKIIAIKGPEYLMKALGGKV